MRQIRPLGPNCLPIAIGGIDDYIEKSLTNRHLGMDLDSSAHAVTYEPALIKSFGAPCMADGIDREAVTRHVQSMANLNYDPAGSQGQGGFWGLTPEDKQPIGPMLVFAEPTTVEIEDEPYKRVLNVGIPLVPIE